MTLRLNRRHFLGTVGAAAAASALPMRAMAATPMTMQAAWVNDAEFAGYFLAMDQGYYADEGLDLTYLSGGPDVIPESTIIAGRADLALTTPDTTIKAIVDQGAPFKIIGAQYQKNPIGIVSLVGSGINSPTYAYDPTPLIKGEIDASLDFTTNVPYTISQQGAEATSFLLYDFGYTTYNDTVVVTDEILNTKRAELVAWLRASRKGWVENNADTTVWPPKWADTHFAGTGRTIDNEVFFNGAQKPLMENPAGVFAMTEEGIEANLGALAEVGIVGSRDMFDTTLLEEI
jgi:ABC-type nitrate/sulfonate/bicarbonate transport system substrate-binding protein